MKLYNYESVLTKRIINNIDHGTTQIFNFLNFPRLSNLVICIQNTPYYRVILQLGCCLRPVSVLHRMRFYRKACQNFI